MPDFSHLSAFALLSAATPAMRDQQKAGRPPGRIVNIVSSAGLFGNFGQSAYASAKAGLVGLTRVVAMDMAYARLSIAYIGNIDQLRDAMGASGLTLTSRGGQWQLSAGNGP